METEAAAQLCQIRCLHSLLCVGLLRSWALTSTHPFPPGTAWALASPAAPATFLLHPWLHLSTTAGEVRPRCIISSRSNCTRDLILLDEPSAFSSQVHSTSLLLLRRLEIQELTVLLWDRRNLKAAERYTLLPNWQDGSCLQSPITCVLLSLVWS